MKLITFFWKRLLSQPFLAKSNKYTCAAMLTSNGNKCKLRNAIHRCHDPFVSIFKKGNMYFLVLTSDTFSSKKTYFLLRKLSHSKIWLGVNYDINAFV